MTMSLGRHRLAAERSVAGIGCLLLLGFGAYWSLRIAYADHLARRSPQYIEAAIRLTPLRAEYWAQLAELQDLGGSDGRPALAVATRLNPNGSQIWIDLALQEESAGNFAAAERDLLIAASVSKQFDPRWSLANYFFRRNDPRFWHWVHEAFSMSYGDRRPLFQLCWNFSADPSAILSQAIPDDNRILGPYLAFLLGYDRMAAAQPVARQMLPRATASDVPILLSFCSRSLVASQPAPALSLWNALADRNLIAYPRLSPESGIILTNQDFHAEPLAAGFDWKPGACAGVSVSRASGELTITLNGRQPENCDLLSQIVPLDPGRRYEINFEYWTSGVRPDSGLSWKLFAANGIELPTRSPLLSSDAWKPGHVDFTAAAISFARLALVYRRSAGTVRIDGAIAIRNLRAGLAP